VNKSEKSLWQLLNDWEKAQRSSDEAEFETRLKEDVAPRTNIPFEPAMSGSTTLPQLGGWSNGGAYYGNDDMPGRLPPHFENRNRLDVLIQRMRRK
jgi:hypothetical protein